MPRRKKQVTVEDDEPLARLPETPDGTALVSPTDERRQRELEDVLEEIGQDGRVKVWHVTDGKATYGGEMTMDGFTLDALFDNYGGGEKTLVFYQGRRRVDTLRVSLDASVPATNPREKKMLEQQAKNGGGGSTGGLADMSAFMTMMMTNQMSSMDMFQKMMLLQAESNRSMMAGFTTLITARPEKDPTDMALRLAEVLRPASPANDALTTFREALKMGMDIAGTGGDGDGTTELIGKGLEVVGHAISAARTPPALPAPVASPPQVRQIPPTPNGTSSVAEPAPAQPTQTLPVDMTPLPSDRLWVRATRPMVPMLASALQFMSGDSAAVELLRRSSDDVIDDLMNDLDDETPPGFLGRVQALFPAFRPSSDWAQQFIDALREGVEEEVDSEETPSVGNRTSSADPIR